MTADLLLVTGPPGAGKSTVAALLVEHFPTAALVPGDAFFGFWVRGAIAPWLPEADGQNDVVTRAAAAAAGTLAAGGCTVVYDGVVGPWFLPAFAAASGLDSLHYAVLLPSLEQCLHRVAQRRGHGFTDADATRRMHVQFAEAAVDERHVLRDPVGEPADVAREVLRRCADGMLLHRA